MKRAAWSSPTLVESRRIALLAAPVAAAQVGVMLMAVVDTMMVGHFSRTSLAAAALGNLWIGGTRIVGMGVILGIDPIVSQAHGARDPGRAGLALQRGLILSLLVSAPIALLWWHTGDVLVWMGQEATLAREAHVYVMVQAPTLPAFFVFTALRAWLQCRGIMSPAMWLIFLANGLNVLLNWFLIFGNLGFPALGLKGAGIATAVVQVFLVLALAFLVVRHRLHRGGWRGWSRAALRPAGLREVLGLGLPLAIQLGLELWAFALVTLWAGYLGELELAAHAIAINLASISFMVPLGVSIGSVTRVGNLVGAGDRRRAQHAAWAALALGGLAMLVSAAVFILFRRLLPALYTPDDPVRDLCASILPIAATFQLFDGLQVVGSGVLRGMGKTRPAAIFNLVGYYLLALPLAWWLAFPLGAALGLAGLWWGLCFGLAVVAALLVVWIGCRGPAHRPAVDRRDPK